MIHEEITVKYFREYFGAPRVVENEWRTQGSEPGWDRFGVMGTSGEGYVTALEAFNETAPRCMFTKSRVVREEVRKTVTEVPG